MADKDKKNKKRQIRKQIPQEFSLDDLDESDLDFLGELVDEEYENKIVEDGYRIVGPTQAMLDYAKPLLDKCESEAEIEQVLSLAQMFWMLAILEGTESLEEVEIKKKLAELDSPEAKELFSMMRERFRLMFPTLADESPFYIKERVLEEDIEEFVPFDESALQINDNVVPPTKDELRLAETLRIFNNEEDEDVEDEDVEDYEDKLTKWQDKILDCYTDWCRAVGVPDDESLLFAQVVSHFLSFLYDNYLEVPSDHIPDEAIQEFMEVYYIKKVWAPSGEKSMMPVALKLFIRYMDEKGIIPGIKSLLNIIESEQDTFLRNLKLYTNPTQKI